MERRHCTLRRGSCDGRAPRQLSVRAVLLCSSIFAAAQGDGMPSWEEVTAPLTKAGIPSWAIAAGLGAVGTSGAVAPYVNQLPASGFKTVAAAPAALLGGVVGSTIETGDYVGTAAKFSNILSPGCPETRFEYPWFGNTISGYISATMPGWEAKVMCDGNNYYDGPAIACKKGWKGFMGSKMEEFVFVKKEDLEKDSGSMFLAQQMRCKARPAEQGQRGRQLADAGADAERSAWTPEAWQEAEQQAAAEFRTWVASSRHTGAKLFVSISLASAFAVAVAEILIFARRRRHKQEARSYEHLATTEA